MSVRIASVAIECVDVRQMADFWLAALLDYVPRGEISEEGGVEFGVIEDPKDRDVELMFIKVPEGKAVKNRVGLVVGTDDIEAEMQRLVGLGATVIEQQSGASMPVLSDPEGNEFSVFQTWAGNSIKSWRP